MMCDKVYEVDFLFSRPLDKRAVQPDECLKLRLPSKEKDAEAIMYVPTKEGAILAKALNCLPWTPIPWSIHRGLRDLLMAYAKRTLNDYRSRLAEKICDTVREHHRQLKANHWKPAFVDDDMADTVLAGGGNSADSIRVLTAVAYLLWGRTWDLDETKFWTEIGSKRETAADGIQQGFEDSLSQDAIIALVSDQ